MNRSFFGEWESRDRWTPRPRDLPSARALRLVPELAGVENNPVYRRALHRRRTRIAASWTPVRILSLVVFGSIVATSFARSWNADAYFFGFVLLLFARMLHKRFRRDHPEMLVGELALREWADLADAGYPPRDAAIGCAAPYLADRRGGRTIRLLPGTAMSAAGLVVHEFLGEAGWMGFSFLLPVGSMVLGWGCVEASSSYLGAGMLREEIRRARRSVGADSARGPDTGFAPLMMFVVFGCLIAAWVLPLILACAFTATVGVLACQASLRIETGDAPREFEELVDDIQGIMERAQRAVRPEDWR